MKRLLKSLRSRRLPVNHAPGTTERPSTIQTQKFIRAAKDIQYQLQDFSRKQKPNCNYISLGQNCSSAWYLKQIGLKTESYPFDWVFSSPEIILDCINNNFSKFLEKALVYAKPDGESAGHSYYHSNLFSHRNPIKSGQDYEYYKRCCSRFSRQLDSESNIMFLMTLINEPSKRPEWANGFTQEFRLPKNQDASSIQSIVDTIIQKNMNSKFIVIDHYTEQERSITCEIIDKNIFFITFNAGGGSTGVQYADALDDFCYKLIFTGLL